MKILIFSDHLDLCFDIKGKNKPDVAIQRISKLSKCPIDSADIVYLDIDGLTTTKISQFFQLLKSRLSNSAIGIYDSCGSIIDPAALFHDGAADYLGPSILSTTIDSIRFKRVIDYIGGPVESVSQTEMHALQPAGSGSFPGWDKMRSGQLYDFFFLYIAIGNPTSIKTKIGEKRYNELLDRLNAYLHQVLSDLNSLAWMKNDSSTLFLLPPDEEKARNAIFRCLKINLTLPLTAYEVFYLEIPLTMIFAIHYGNSPYHAPGKTGTLISEDVNYIFHLGAKKAEPGRVTISSQAMSAIPNKLASFFKPAGVFETKEICSSKLFI